MRELGCPVWERVVEAARAQILSQISTSQCDAYLLSESSLFVYDDRFALITCWWQDPAWPTRWRRPSST
ncbi:MAG: hypothetical protein R3F62_29460 [Planctomycetota bacterium]